MLILILMLKSVRSANAGIDTGVNAGALRPNWSGAGELWLPGNLHTE